MALMKPTTTTKTKDTRADIFADRIKQIAAQTPEMVTENETITTLSSEPVEEIKKEQTTPALKDKKPIKEKNTVSKQGSLLNAKKFVSISADNEHLLKTYAFITKMQSAEKTESQIVNDALDYYFSFLKKSGKLVSIDISSLTSGK